MKKTLSLLTCFLGLSTAVAKDFSSDYFSVGIESGYTVGSEKNNEINGVVVGAQMQLLNDDYHASGSIGLSGKRPGAEFYGLTVNKASEPGPARGIVGFGLDASFSPTLEFGTIFLALGLGKNANHIFYGAPALSIVDTRDELGSKLGLGAKFGYHFLIGKQVLVKTSVDLQSISNENFTSFPEVFVYRYGAEIFYIVSDSISLTLETNGAHVVRTNAKNSEEYTITGGILFHLDF